MSTVRLLTPHDDISGPKLADALPLGDDRYVLTEILGLDVLMPGDVVTADSTGVITGVEDPADVWAWEVDFPIDWSTSKFRQVLVKAVQYRRDGAYVVVGTAASLTVVSTDERWGERLAADPDIVNIELVRRPGLVDLDAIISERYPTSS